MMEEKKEGAEVYSIQHGLLNWFQSCSWTPGMHGTHCRLAVFAFVGCRKFDLHQCSQPTSHIPHITTTKTEGSYKDSRPTTGIADTLVIRITNMKSKSAFFSRMLNGYIIPHEPSLLPTGSHISVEGSMTC